MQAPLLKTKLYAPPTRLHAVRRSALLSQLDQALEKKLTLLCAPAGFGKTTLLSEWITLNEPKLAWISLDEEMNSASRFLLYLITSLDTLVPGIADELLGILYSSLSHDTNAIVTLLANTLAESTSKIVVVFDDYHRIDSVDVDAIIETLVDIMPQHMHVIIASRKEPKLPLARMRVEESLTEIRSDELRFSKQEAEFFFKDTCKIQLSREQVELLEEKTEGWAAGLQLAALSFRKSSDKDASIQNFAGSHSFIAEYLLSEVLYGLDLNQKHFLLATSILDRFSAKLCDQMLQLPSGSSNKMLDHFRSSNIFLIPLDDQQHWFRYHHLFSELLQKQLQDTAAYTVDTGQLYERASTWFYELNYFAEAVTYALKGRHFILASQIIEHAWIEMDTSFQHDVWLSWADQLPLSIFESSPVLLSNYAWALLDTGKDEGLEFYLAKAESLFTLDSEQKPKVTSEYVSVSDMEQFLNLPSSIAGARAYHAQTRGDYQQAEVFAQKMLRFADKNNFFTQAQADSFLGISAWARGDLRNAFDKLQSFKKGCIKAGIDLFAVASSTALIEILIHQGSLHKAEIEANKIITDTTEKNQTLLWATASLYLALAHIALLQGKLTRVADMRAEAIRQAQHARLDDFNYKLSLLDSSVAIAKKQYKLAFICSDEAEQYYFPNPTPPYQPLHLLKARILLKQQKIAEVERHMQGSSTLGHTQIRFMDEYLALTEAQLMLSLYEDKRDAKTFEHLSKLLRQIRDAALPERRLITLVETSVLCALAYELAGDNDEANSYTKEAIDFAENEEIILPFINEGRQMMSLLSEVAEEKRYAPFVEMTLESYELLQHSEEIKHTNNSLVEPLSERELQILRLISQGFSNQEISKELGLALSTVKGHNQNIFGKLGVARRTEAVARAQSLELL